MSEEETYTGEFKIKNVVGKNLLETYEVNGRTYTDNIPENFLISIPKKQYIEYEQQKEEIERLHSIIKEVREYIEKELSFNVVINGKENKVIGYNKAFDKILEILEKES